MFKSGLKKELANSVKTLVVHSRAATMQIGSGHISIALVGVADASKEYINVQVKEEAKSVAIVIVVTMEERWVVHEGVEQVNWEYRVYCVERW